MEQGPVGAVERRRFLQLMGLGAAGVALGACNSGSSGPAGSTNGGGSTTTTTTFPIGAAAKASSRPVPVTMWHSMTENNLTTLKGLATTFNTSQGDVRVSLVNQTSYQDTLTTYTAALGNPANLPDLVLIESIDTQIIVDSKSVVPVAAAVAADHFDLSPLLSAAVEYFTIEDILWGMPWNESSQILYYDQNAFERAGLDPSAPPLTLDDYRAAAEAIVSKRVAKYGTSLKLTASNLEDWCSQAGHLFVNHDNGRTGRATAVAFGDATGASLFEWFASMLSSKLAQATPSTGSGTYDNLLAVGSGVAPMSIDTSAALGTVLAVLQSAYKNVKLGVGPLPAPKGPGGLPYGGGGLFLVDHSPPERQDGAWQFVKYLLGAKPMATWSLGSGYIPINTSSVELAAVRSAWAKAPEYKVAYEEILATKPSPATAGAVVGPFTEIETIVNNALSAMSNGTTASSALSTAVRQSNAAIASYNQRV